MFDELDPSSPIEIPAGAYEDVVGRAARKRRARFTQVAAAGTTLALIAIGVVVVSNAGSGHGVRVVQAGGGLGGPAAAAVTSTATPDGTGATPTAVVVAASPPATPTGTTAPRPGHSPTPAVTRQPPASPTPGESPGTPPGPGPSVSTSPLTAPSPSPSSAPGPVQTSPAGQQGCPASLSTVVHSDQSTYPSGASATITVVVSNGGSTPCAIAQPYPQAFSSPVKILDASGALLWAPGPRVMGVAVMPQPVTLNPGQSYTWATVSWDLRSCTGGCASPGISAGQEGGPVPPGTYTCTTNGTPPSPPQPVTFMVTG